MNYLQLNYEDKLIKNKVGDIFRIFNYEEFVEHLKDDKGNIPKSQMGFLENAEYSFFEEDAFAILETENNYFVMVPSGSDIKFLSEEEYKDILENQKGKED